MITTGAELKTFTEEFLDNRTIGTVLFYELANFWKDIVEAERDWMVLKSENTDETSNVADTFLTMKDLPDGFGGMIEVFTAKSDGSSWLFYAPILFKKRYAFQNIMRGYYIDIANNQFALTGRVNEARTIHLIYRKISAEITSDQGWEFPSRFHPLLGFLIASTIKGGKDYDETNARQVIFNDRDASRAFAALLDWDTNLRTREMGDSYDHGTTNDPDGLPDQESFEVPLGDM